MNNNINKNVSVWRGNNTPPTDYHLWIKSDGNMFINDGQEFQDYKVVSGAIKDASITRTRDHVNIELTRYSGDKLPISIPFSTQSMAGVMSTADKTVVDRANTLLNSSPLVGKLRFIVSDDKRQLEYQNNGNNVFNRIPLPQFGEKLTITNDNTPEGKYTIKLLGLGYSSISSIEIPVVNNQSNGIMSYQDKRDLDSLLTQVSDINNVLYSQYTSAKITVSPTIIEKGVNNVVTIKWESSFNGQVVTPDATEVKQGGVTFSNTPNYSVSRTLTDTTDFSLSITYKGVNKTASARVNAYYPKYYGQSTKTTLTSSDILGFTKQTISSSAAGSGSMNVSEGNYVWFCVPSTMTINKVTSSGFDVPMEAPINVEVSGKGTYKCYRSSNTFKAGTFTYQIS